jgi:hypothetical protein
MGAHWAGMETIISARMGAGALLIGQSYWLLFLAPKIRNLDPSQRALFSGRFVVLFAFLAGASITGQVFALIGLASASLFFMGLLLSLGYASLGFVRLLFIRPESQ